MITHKSMSLFDAPKGAILVHACNCQGVWGAGIAAEFAKRFPQANKDYTEFCKFWNNKLEGAAVVLPEENGYMVGCLMTSGNYGDKVDSPQDILINTALSLGTLFRLIYELGLDEEPIYSNKFNSGLFGVPWEETEKVLQKAAYIHDDKEWVVCSV